MNILKTIKSKAILGGKIPLASSIFVGAMIAFCLLGIIMPRATNADLVSTANASYVAKTAIEAQKAVKTIQVVVTAYSRSGPDR